MDEQYWARLQAARLPRYQVEQPGVDQGDGVEYSEEEYDRRFLNACGIDVQDQ